MDIHQKIKTKNQPTSMKPVYRLSLLILIFLGTTPSFAQSKKNHKSIFKTLQFGKVTPIIIETDLDSLINYRNRNTYQPAIFTHGDSRGKVHIHDMRIRPRGKFRRKVCDFPMFKIDFSKKDLKKRRFAKFDDYKLVTHCMNTTNESFESVAREYLVYKLYNILSPNSYNVQFLYINYLDSKKKIPDFQHFGFIIEDTAELANRIDGKFRKEISGMTSDSLKIIQHDFVALFQYMVGNADWTARPISRNVKLVKIVGEEEYHTIPFDFDFAGLVAAPYAVPNSGIGQKNIRHRIYQGLQKKSDIDPTTISHFLDKKKKIQRYIKRFRLLSKASRADILNYLGSFFEEIESGAFLNGENG